MLLITYFKQFKSVCRLRLLSFLKHKTNLHSFTRWIYIYFFSCFVFSSLKHRRCKVTFGCIYTHTHIHYWATYTYRSCSSKQTSRSRSSRRTVLVLMLMPEQVLEQSQQSVEDSVTALCHFTWSDTLWLLNGFNLQ